MTALHAPGARASEDGPNSAQDDSANKTWKRLQDILRARAESDSSGTLLFYSEGNLKAPSEEVSYSRLYQRAKCYAATLGCLPTFAENRTVLIHLDDHYDCILWFWSVLLAGGLPVLSPPFSNLEEHRRKHIQALSGLLERPVCVTRRKFFPLFGEDHGFVLRDVESLEAETLQNGAAVCTAPPHGNPANPDGGAPGRRILGAEGAAGTAMLMLTSGSTGNAKAVRITHRQVLASVAGKSAACPLPSNRSFLNWIGLDHVGALVEIHLHALWLGVDQIHVPAAALIASPRAFLDLLSHHRVSRSFAPNFFLARLVATVDSDGPDPAWDFADLRFLVSGGEANDVKTCVAVSALLSRHGAPDNALAPGFGMTETCAGSIYNRDCPRYDVASGRTVASLGRCIEGMDMRVVAADGALAQPGSFGELQVCGPVVFEGYYGNPGATAQAFTADGWFRTGDQATLDKHGWLHLVGRVNEVININGIKFIAADLQTSLEQALGNRVVRLVVFGTRGPHSERITIAYMPPRDRAQSAQNLLNVQRTAAEVCMLSTASQPLIFAVTQRSEPLLPVSALGKISRAKMRSLFEAGRFAGDMKLHDQAVREAQEEARSANGHHHDPDDNEPANEAEALLLEDFAATHGVPVEAYGPNTSVFDQGFTSMDLIRLKHRIDTRLGTTVPVILVLKNPTARSLAAALQHFLADRDDDVQRLAQAPAPAAASSAPVYDPVVTFSTAGDKTPLWLVHPGVGEVLVFIGLAQHLGHERPIHALRAPGFESETQARFGSVDEAVSTYVSAVRRRQPRGPYALGGYSYGAMLAFEMAKRLGAEDGPGAVRFLASFNLPPHIKLRMRYLNWNLVLLNLTCFLGLTSEATHGLDEPSFREWPRCEARARVLALADAARMAELGLDEHGLLRWADLAHGLQSMACDYEPSGWVESIDVFHAEPLSVVAASRDEWMRDYLSRWADFSRTPPVFHGVGGTHYTMMDAEHVGDLSARLMAALQARGV